MRPKAGSKSAGARKKRAAAGSRRPRDSARSASIAELCIREIESLRKEVEQRRAELLPRWNANPEDVQRSVAQLVLALVEFLRKLLERQAIRRMEAESLSPEEIERVGLALMRLEQTVH